jgi:acetyl esterase
MKEKGGPEITLNIRMWPVVDANFESESFNQFGEKPFLTLPLMKWMWDRYTTDAKEHKELYGSPVEQLKGLPLALVM